MSRPTLAIIVTVVWGVFALPRLLAAALAPMFFDAPGSMNNPLAWINALIVVSFPVLCLLSIGATWLFWFARKGRAPSRAASSAQIALACLPLLPIGYVAIAMVLETAGVLLSGQPMGLHSTIIKQ
ncbi:MAG TPA: hypothetical protein VHR97_03725 [Candidatus Baltobacteraceae bacterium]|jgi:hypothetical protein|nr:hypothetical protein [Candidatus Baltobacteraceae bacterium]